jgi:hypothetical protein
MPSTPRNSGSETPICQSATGQFQTLIGKPMSSQSASAAQAVAAASRMMSEL